MEKRQKGPVQEHYSVKNLRYTKTSSGVKVPGHLNQTSVLSLMKTHTCFMLFQKILASAAPLAAPFANYWDIIESY